MAKTSGLQASSAQTTDVDGWVGRETASCQSCHSVSKNMDKA
ncbi:MAG: hypothetical protein Q7J51_04355 [Sheuella sp.]|nr:hypothetical protein [Sheuella sp.]